MGGEHLEGSVQENGGETLESEIVSDSSEETVDM